MAISPHFQSFRPYPTFGQSFGMAAGQQAIPATLSLIDMLMRRQGPSTQDIETNMDRALAMQQAQSGDRMAEESVRNQEQTAGTKELMMERGRQDALDEQRQLAAQGMLAMGKGNGGGGNLKWLTKIYKDAVLNEDLPVINAVHASLGIPPVEKKSGGLLDWLGLGTPGFGEAGLRNPLVIKGEVARDVANTRAGATQNAANTRTQTQMDIAKAKEDAENLRLAQKLKAQEAARAATQREINRRAAATEEARIRSSGLSAQGRSFSDTLRQGLQQQTEDYVKKLRGGQYAPGPTPPAGTEMSPGVRKALDIMGP